MFVTYPCTCISYDLLTNSIEYNASYNTLLQAELSLPLPFYKIEQIVNNWWSSVIQDNHVKLAFDEPIALFYNLYKIEKNGMIW